MKMLITAGPTREALDPVRFLGNRSSGKMGYAISEAAVNAGLDCVLISGPTCLDCPQGVERIEVESAEEMYQAVEKHLSDCEVAVFAAAVADYRPKVRAEQKIKKQRNDDLLTIELERTRDILGSARDKMKYEGVLVGFAAETEDLLANAGSKLKKKGCDLLAANDVSRKGIGFGSDRNQISLLHKDGTIESLPESSKRELAEILVARALEQVDGSA